MKMPSYIPQSLMLELTSQCNFNCPYCYCVWNENRDYGSEELITDEWCKLLSEYIERGVKDITFTGGEVLLRSDLFEIIDYIKSISNEISISIFTNASLLTQKILLQLKERRVEIATSFQGLKTYPQMTGSKHSAKSFLKVLQSSIKLEWSLSVSITVTQVNAHEIIEMVKMLNDMRVRQIQVGPMMAAGRGLGHLGLMLSVNEWKILQRKIEELPHIVVPIVYGGEFACSCRSDLPVYIKETWCQPKNFKCNAGKDYGVIGPDGNYRKCLYMMPQNVGDVL